MFVGFGTLSGGAHAVGQEADRPSFQLVSASKVTYGGRPLGVTAGVEGRKERDGQTVNLGDKANNNDAGQMMQKQNVGSDLPGAAFRP
jgi:hypothetical protein